MLSNGKLAKMPDKLTDKELIKAMAETIERLQAENERLKEQIKVGDKIYEYTCNEFDNDLKIVNEKLKAAKAEAYKECIEKVKTIICDNTYPDFDKNGKAVNIWKSKAYKDIDNILKEMGDT